MRRRDGACRLPDEGDRPGEQHNLEDMESDELMCLRTAASIDSRIYGASVHPITPSGKNSVAVSEASLWTWAWRANL